MTAFDLFQRATGEIADGDNAVAAATLAAAIAQIDKDGIDAHMRDDLVDLRNDLLKEA